MAIPLLENTTCLTVLACFTAFAVDSNAQSIDLSYDPADLTRVLGDGEIDRQTYLVLKGMYDNLPDSSCLSPDAMELRLPMLSPFERKEIITKISPFYVVADGVAAGVTIGSSSPISHFKWNASDSNLSCNGNLKMAVDSVRFGRRIERLSGDHLKFECGNFIPEVSDNILWGRFLPDSLKGTTVNALYGGAADFNGFCLGYHGRIFNSGFFLHKRALEYGDCGYFGLFVGKVSSEIALVEMSNDSMDRRYLFWRSGVGNGHSKASLNSAVSLDGRGQGIKFELSIFESGLSMRFRQIWFSKDFNPPMSSMATSLRHGDSLGYSVVGTGLASSYKGTFFSIYGNIDAVFHASGSSVSWGSSLLLRGYVPLELRFDGRTPDSGTSWQRITVELRPHSDNFAFHASSALSKRAVGVLAEYQLSESADGKQLGQLEATQTISLLGSHAYDLAVSVGGMSAKRGQSRGGIKASLHVIDGGNTIWRTYVDANVEIFGK